MSSAASGAAVACGVLACAGGEPPPRPAIEDNHRALTSVELNEFEISAVAPDRFVHCPPPGELGQEWIPAVPPWHPGPPPATSSPSSSPSAPSPAFAVPPGGDLPSMPPRPQATHQEETAHAMELTRIPFRGCYHHGLLYDPTQDGHVAIVMRVAADGSVAKVESYGACDLSSEVVQCMLDSAKTLRFDPPAEGSDTITIPAVFHPQGAERTQPLPSEPYAAAAYVVVEQARPAFHACEARAHGGNKDRFASATFTIELDSRGTVAHQHLDPWTGNQEMLGCAAEAIGALTFAPPPGGRGRLVVRLVFNPRPRTR